MPNNSDNLKYMDDVAPNRSADLTASTPKKSASRPIDFSTARFHSPKPASSTKLRTSATPPQISSAKNSAWIPATSAGSSQVFGSGAWYRGISSQADRRQLSLTPKGRSEFATLDQRSHEEIRTKLGQLSAADREELIQSLERVETLLGKRTTASVPFVLRPHRAGDMGWVVDRHGVLYAQEYGWDSSCEALIAEIAAQFIRNFDPKREAGCIAERNGDRVGSVFLVRKTDEVAQLRLLLVEPSARGLGLGRHLVKECVRFAGDARYRNITLWTNGVLHAARRIYEETGFRLVDEKPHHSFGKDLVGRTWELAIANP